LDEPERHLIANQNSIPSTLQSDDNPLARLRAALLQKLLWVAAVLGLFSLSPVLTGILSGDGHEMRTANVLIAVYFCLIACTFLSRIPFTIRAIVLVLMFFVASIGSLLDYGMVSASRPFGITFVVVTGLLLGGRGGLMAIGAYVACTIFIAWIILTGRMEVLPDYQEFNSHAVNWRAFVVNFILTSSLTLLPVTFLVSALGKLMQSLEEKVESRTNELVTRNADLEEALGKVNQLSGLLPICSGCKKVRDDQGYWEQVESYIVRHSDAQFSHGICPDCADKIYPGIKGGSPSEHA
jgi:hypothetical protein